MCRCECCISAKSIHNDLLSWRYCHLKNMKYQSEKPYNRIWGKLESRIYETYKISDMPHGCRINKTAEHISISTMCDVTLYQHDLTHWKCVLCCCSKCPSIVEPNYELHSNTQRVCPTFLFNIHTVVSRCTLRGRRPFEEKRICVLCSTVKSVNSNGKVYFRK